MHENPDVGISGRHFRNCHVQVLTLRFWQSKKIAKFQVRTGFPQDLSESWAYWLHCESQSEKEAGGKECGGSISQSYLSTESFLLKSGIFNYHFSEHLENFCPTSLLDTQFSRELESHLAIGSRTWYQTGARKLKGFSALLNCYRFIYATTIRTSVDLPILSSAGNIS